MKKEVIYFSGFSLGICDTYQLLDSNNLKVSSLEKGTEIKKVEDYKILSFWDKVNELNVWNWKKSYNSDDICDGYMWEVKLGNRQGKAKYSSKRGT